MKGEQTARDEREIGTAEVVRFGGLVRERHCCCKVLKFKSQSFKMPSRRISIHGDVECDAICNRRVKGSKSKIIEIFLPA